MSTDNGTRRHLLVLLKRQKHVDERVGRAQRGGVRPFQPLHVRRLVDEAGALAWAVAELERLHPMAAAAARQALQREEERRRERGAATPA